MKYLPTLLILISLLLSCSNGCELTRESFCLAELNQTGESKLLQLYAWGIGQGKGEKDSLGVASDVVMLTASNPKSLEFILNPDSTVTDIRLQMTVKREEETLQVSDTLHFVYEPRPVFLNLECGCSVYFTLKDVASTGHFLQNVTIKKSEITNVQNINLSIEY